MSWEDALMQRGYSPCSLRNLLDEYEEGFLTDYEEAVMDYLIEEVESILDDDFD